MTTVKIIRSPTEQDWLEVKNSALSTMGKQTKELPNNEWKMKLLASEHSPIRDLWYKWEWIDLPSWISVHFVRHNIGIVRPDDIVNYVQSQRNDRQDKYNRNKAPQDAPVTHKCSANAQAIINMSKVRLCKKASPETQQAWKLFLNKLFIYDPFIVSLCVPNCIYRNGRCTEFYPCGFNQTRQFQNINEQYNDVLSEKKHILNFYFEEKEK